MLIRSSNVKKWLVLLVLAMAFTPLAIGCEAEEEPALEGVEDPDPPLEEPVPDEDEDPLIEDDPDFDEVEDPDPPVEDPALDENVED